MALIRDGILVVLLSFLVVNTAYSHLSEKSLEHLAQKLGSEIFRLTKSASGHNEAVEGFRKMGAKIEKLDPATAMKEISQTVTALMGKKVAAVKRLVETAEELTKAYEWDPEINITYRNAKEMEQSNVTGQTSPPVYGFAKIQFAKDPRFHNELVNVTHSTVHVPTNIWNRSPAVQNGAQWSEKLDRIFRDNLEDDPTMRSQYFGSSEGFLRLYPGVKWLKIDGDKPDMYDCRLTNWYIRASSSPKDMIILVDISGSMTGIREEIARTTVKEIMNTLHEDDFFNIIKFKEEAQFLDPRVDTTIQASEATKRRYAELLGTLETENIANYTEAFLMAFQALNSSAGAECNKAIMVVSDGAPESFQELFAHLNPEKRVRIFTYVIGREVTVYDEMKAIACDNRGYVTHISTMADVRNHVETYSRVLSRPMVLSTNHTNIWTNAYWHARNNIGMVITVAQPVFNRSAAALKKGSLIGVVGIDVPILDIKKAMTPHKWGVGSYIFGTNHNGHVIFHPYWRTQNKKNISPRQSYNEIDLGQVEFPTAVDLEETSGGEFDLPLRKFMIDQQLGQVTSKIMRQLDDRKRVYEKEYIYYYGGISETPLSVGIAVPVSAGRPDNELLNVKGRLAAFLFGLDTAMLTDNLTETRLHPEWAYCNVSVSSLLELLAHVEPRFAQIQRDMLQLNSSESEDETEQTIPVSCDSELVESLLFDIKATENAVKLWSNIDQANSQLYAKYDIETAFLITRAGLTRWKDFQLDPLFEANAIRTMKVRDVMGNDGEEVGKEVEVDREVIAVPDESGEPTSEKGNGTDTENTTRHFFEQYSKAVDESFYERTVTGDHETTVIISLSQGPKNINEISFMAAVPVFVEEGTARSTPAGITGIIMKTRRLRDLLLDVSRETCQGGDCMSCHSESISCYLVDESGYVVVSTRFAEDRGKFFGILHGEVMSSIVDNGIYKRFKLHDYQGVCQTIKKVRTKSAGFSLRPWIYGVLESIQSLGKHTFAFLVALHLELVTAESEYYNFENAQQLDSMHENATAPIVEAPTNPPFLCDMKYDLYHSGWTQLKSLLTVECAANCTKSVGVYKVSTTNMLLVAMDKTRACPCNESPLFTAPEEIVYTDEQMREKYTAVPYRRRPSDCFPYHADEDASDCGSGASTLAAHGLLLGFSSLLARLF
ncbi:hypothetical protein RvY_11351-2 [Ramazzottius varieornatus]|uniref:VWFA domain-containing protein n=1 Tax=Ramazzottius varieornatus TaxID=947166 RepID=A0A1D1VI93_RAMVA|nr:hypothetical protein RvY_11351-2 [Ramazzottius varieornatus]